MTRFSYRAYEQDGTPVKGTIEAESRLAAARALSRTGRKIVDIVEQDWFRSQAPQLWKTHIGSGSVNYRRTFAELAILLQAGFTIDAALKAVVGANPANGFQDVVLSLGSGSTFSDAVARLPRVDPAVVALLASGEHSGRLDEAITVIAGMFEEDRKRNAEVLEALLYPTFLVFMMVFAIGVIMFALVPAIDPVFEGIDDKRPVLISAFSTVRFFLLSHGWVISATISCAAFVLIWALQKPMGRQAISALWLKMPMIGGIVSNRGRARYLYVLGMLLSNGVPMKKALDLASRACPVVAYQPRMNAVMGAVTAGVPFRQAAKDVKLFDQTSLSLIEVGDEANKLPDALKRAAFLLETRSSRDIRRLLALMTPAMTLIMGGVIGGIVVSVMDALLSINSLAVQ